MYVTQRDLLSIPDGDEGVREAREKCGREFRVQGETQARSAGGNSGRPDGPHGKSFAAQEGGKSDPPLIFAEKNGNDLCIARADIKTSFAQFGPQEGCQGGEIISFSIRRGHDANRGAHLCGKVRRQCRAENKSPRVIDEILLELFRAAHKTTHAGKRLTARMDGDQNAIAQAARGDQTVSLRAYDAGGVGFVDDELGTVFFREGNEIGDRGAVAIHAENAFGDDEFLSSSGNTRAGEIA